MSKMPLVLAAALLTLSAPAARAENKLWIVTEENSGGVKNAQGNWNLKIDGGKISGAAEMQLYNGEPLTYKFEGAMEGAEYKIKLTDRSDGKKGCVWTGHTPKPGGEQTSGLVGYAECDGGIKLILRASF